MSQARSRPLDPVVMMIAAVAFAIVLTWIIPAGLYARAADGNALPGSYHLVPGHRASPVALFTSLPLGMIKSAGLIFMIMFLGGMFGVLRATGAIDAAIERIVALSGSRPALVVPFLMLVISAGSTFLGLASEYLLIIPLVVALARRLDRSVLFGFAMVAVSSKIGYLASVTNPVILMVAQPIAGVPVFSGLAWRLTLWVGFLAIGVGTVLWVNRRLPPPALVASKVRLSLRQSAIVVVMIASVVLVVVGSSRFHWKDSEFGAGYAAVAVLIGILAGMKPSELAHGFVEGMKSMALAGLLVGMASAVEVVLVDAKVLDSVVHRLASLTSGLPRVWVGEALVGVEMILTLVIPSASAKAAVSMPILVPIARMAGISGQSTVLAFLLGNGLVNMISPTSGMLLAYLATAQLSYGVWFRFVLPLFCALAALSFAAIAIAIHCGY